eukprot:104767-Pelagomonas_calceolata.AAC.2
MLPFHTSQYRYYKSKSCPLQAALCPQGMGRSPICATSLEDLRASAALRPQGMGLSAAAALHTHLCVQRLVGLLQVCAPTSYSPEHVLHAYAILQWPWLPACLAEMYPSAPYKIYGRVYVVH